MLWHFGFGLFQDESSTTSKSIEHILCVIMCDLLSLAIPTQWNYARASEISVKLTVTKRVIIVFPLSCKSSADWCVCDEQKPVSYWHGHLELSNSNLCMCYTRDYNLSLIKFIVHLWHNHFEIPLNKVLLCVARFAQKCQLHDLNISRRKWNICSFLVR